MKKQDKTPVLINLVSTIRDEEGEQEAPMQLFCRGELKKTASGYLIRYQESMPTEDDSEMVTSDVILSLSEHRVTMSRPGEYGTTMVFVKDQRFEGAYHTPFGDGGVPDAGQVPRCGRRRDGAPRISAGCAGALHRHAHHSH